MKCLFKILIVLSVGITSLNGQSISIDTAKINAFITSFFNKSTVKGLSVSIVDKEKVVFEKGYGKNINGKSTQSNSPLFIGSVSKVITGLGICVLKDQGKLQLNEPITKYLSDTKLAVKSDISGITVRDLLHHHSGFSQESGYDKNMEFKGDFEGINPIAKAGTKGMYSSLNSALLGLIIEEASGMSYSSFLEKEVFQPLGMTNSSVPTAKAGQTEKGYCFAYGFPLKIQQMAYGPTIIPAGYIVSSASDLSKMTQMLLNNGKVLKDSSEITFLQPSTVQEIFTPYNGGKYGYGISWGIGSVEGEKTYQHEGMTKISNARSIILPEKEVAINLIANTNSGPFFSITSEIGKGIIDLINNRAAPSTFPKELVIRLLFGFLMLRVMFEFFQKYRSWKNAAYPKKIQLNFKKKRQILFTIIPFIVLLVLPKFIHVPVQMLLRIMPDIGIALVVSGLLALFSVFILLFIPVDS